MVRLLCHSIPVQMAAERYNPFRIRIIKTPRRSRILIIFRAIKQYFSLFLRNCLIRSALKNKQDGNE